MRGVCDFIDSAIESVLVCFRRFGEAAQFPNELQRRRVNFIIRRRWTEIMQGFDGSTHKKLLTADAVVSKVESIARMKTIFFRRSFPQLFNNSPSAVGALRIAILSSDRNHEASSAVIEFPNM